MASILEPGLSLRPGEYLVSRNGAFELSLQPDGNLVLYRLMDHNPVWSTGTLGQAVSRLIMQPDGNLVLYGFPDAIWQSNTAGHPGSWLSVQDDGNLVIYPPSSPIWSIH